MVFLLETEMYAVFVYVKWQTEIDDLNCEERIVCIFFSDLVLFRIDCFFHY